MIDARARRGLLPAVAGLVLGIAALVADLPALGLAAGACGLLVLWATSTGRMPARPEPTRAPTPADVEPPAPRPAPAAGPDPVPAPAPSSPAERPADAAERAPQPGSSLVDTNGLFSEAYFHLALETRVSAARRHLRPVAVVLFEVTTVGQDVDGPADASLVATAIRATLREADTACRLSDGRYAFVLEDTPEDGALWTMERFRRVLQAAEPDAVRWAGIACYPAHAFNAEGVLAKAEAALLSAKEWSQDRVEVARPD